MRLFTVDLELGEQTRETLTRISSTSVIQLELGPQTRAMLERLLTPTDDGGSTVGGLVKKGADSLRPG